MVAAGVDVGARSVKVVLLAHHGGPSARLGEPSADGAVVGRAQVVSGDEAAVAASDALDAALAEAGLRFDDIAFAVATGSGRSAVPFARRHSSEVACQGRGAFFLHPEARTVVNLGAESSRALRLNESGRVETFATHDKCAAGSGLFLEAMSRLLGVPLEDIDELALAALRQGRTEEVASMCAVFAESEVISHIHRGVPKEQILAGVHRAVVDRVVEVVYRVGVNPPLLLTGGVALNRAIVAEMARRLRVEVKVAVTPEFVGALGAALIAADQLPKD